MTPQELKSSILQLAVQGRLVEQRPEEGTAEELLKLVTINNYVEGRRVKEKTITEISNDEMPFSIPDSWVWVKLGNVCTIARGGSPRPIKDYLTTDIDGVNWIKIGDTEKNGKYISSTKEKIKPSGISKSRMVHKGDFLLTNSMSFGRPYILNIDGCIHDGWLVISQSSEVFFQDYLYWILSSAYAYFQFCGQVSGAVVKNLNSDKVANSVFPLPPLAEQKRIVAKIEELLPYIDRYEKAWSKLEDFNKRFPGDMQKSVLQMAIQGKLVEQRPEEGTGEELYRQIQAEKQSLIISGKIKKEKPLPEISEDEIPFDIPESWRWVRLRDLGVTQTGNTPPKSHPEYFGQDIPFITPGDIALTNIDYNNQGISFYGENVARICNAESILQVCIGGSIGKAAITNRKVAFNQQINTITPLQCLSEYLFSVFQSAYFITTMKEKAGGTATPIINRGLWDKLLIPLPPLAEQKRIVQKLEEILPLCEKLK